MRRRFRSLSTLGLLALVSVMWFGFAPRQIGGAVTYVTTYGISMLPDIHAGDLILARPHDSYGVGDTVAYYSPTVGAVVLHRIAHDRGDHFVTRGDNNSWDDPDMPTKDDVYGKQWIHIKQGGTVLRWLTKPVHLAVGAVALMGLAGTGRRRGRDDGSLEDGEQKVPPMRHSGLPNEAIWAAVLAVAAVALAIVSFTRPLMTVGEGGERYSQRITFDYSADTTPNAVYPDGKVHWGDPVYSQLIDTVTLRANYQLNGSVSGTQGLLTVRTEMRASNGWHRNLSSVPVQFKGNNAQAELELNLDSLKQTVEQVEKAAGVRIGEVIIAVTAEVHADSTVDGDRVKPTQTARVEFTLGSGQLTLARKDASATTDSGKLKEARPHANTISFLGRAVPVLWCRLAVFPLGLASLVALAMMIVAVRRRRGPVSGELNHRYRARLVHVNSFDSQQPAIDLVSADDFFRVADQTEAAVLYTHESGRDVYMVVSGAVRYRYCVATSEMTADDYLERLEPHAMI